MHQPLLYSLSAARCNGVTDRINTSAPHRRSSHWSHVGLLLSLHTMDWWICISSILLCLINLSYSKGKSRFQQIKKKVSVGKTIKFSLHIHLRFCVFMNIASRPTLLHIWVMLLFRASYRSTFSPLHFQGGLILCCLNHYHNVKICHMHEAKTTITLIT